MDLWNVYLSHVSFSTSRVDTLSPSAVHIIEEKLVIFLCLFNTNVSETLSSIMVVYDEGFFRSLGSFVGAIQEDTPWKHLFSKCWIVITVSEIALINHRQLLWHTDENKRPPKHPCFPLEQRTQPSDNSAPTALVLTQAQKSWEHGALSLSLFLSLSHCLFHCLSPLSFSLYLCFFLVFISLSLSLSPSILTLFTFSHRLHLSSSFLSPSQIHMFKFKGALLAW